MSLPLVLAPIKGYTDPLWRSCFFDYFKGIDRVVTPFLLLSEHNRAKKGYFPRFLPELERGIEVIPQFLVKRGESLIDAANKMADLGVKEFNLNMGCPAPAIFKKGRGSGLLMELNRAKELFDYILPRIPGDLTVKIRTGIDDSTLLPGIVELLNSYPLKEVIVHPRFAKQLYSGEPDMKAFEYAYSHSKNPVAYNGDIYTLEDYKGITGKYPELSSVMLGRGVLRDPFLPEAIKRDRVFSENERRDKLISYLKDFNQRCSKAYFKEITAFSRVKAIMIYIGSYYIEDESITLIKRAKDLDQIFEIISLN